MRTTIFRAGASAMLLALASAIPGWAISCGTVGTPTACQFIGPDITFTISNFSIGAQNGILANDINIDLFGSGSLVTLTFDKNENGPTPGIVFFANPGDSVGFSFSYNLALTPTNPGTVAFASLSSDLTGSVVPNSFGAVQTIVPGGPTCLMTVANTNHVNCTLPAGMGTASSIGNIVSLTGATSGNVSIVRFSDTITASFTPDTSAVPEPSTFALLVAGLGLIAWRRSTAC